MTKPDMNFTTIDNAFKVFIGHDGEDVSLEAGLSFVAGAGAALQALVNRGEMTPDHPMRIELHAMIDAIRKREPVSED